jgi:sulfur-oxidizing protein SoxX
VLAGCAAAPSVTELNDLAQKIAKASFRDQGIVKAETVLNTDETNRLCSQADVAGKPLDEATAKRIEQTNLKAIKWPSDGKFLGDWKQGEAIAQSGRGLTFTDSASTVNGGNCYNCHQIDKKEISFGTIGPSLYNYGKIRGVADPSSAGARSGTPRPTTPAPTCRAPGTWASSAKRRCAMWWPCCSTPTRRSTSDRQLNPAWPGFFVLHISVEGNS